MRSSAAAASEGDISEVTEPSERAVRTASPATRASDESATDAAKSATTRRADCFSFPFASNEPSGPMPAARSPRKAAVPSPNAPAARAPMRAVRCQLTYGAACTASPAIVPVANPGERTAIRADRRMKPVPITIGRPASAIAIAPGSPHSGRPMMRSAANAVPTIATAAAPHRASAPAVRISGDATEPLRVSGAPSSASSTASADAGRASGSLASMVMIRLATCVGRSGRSVPTCTGAWLRCAANCDCGVAAANNRRPVHASCNTQPSA